MLLGRFTSQLPPDQGNRAHLSPGHCQRGGYYKGNAEVAQHKNQNTGNGRRNFVAPLFLVFDYPSPDAPKGVRGTANIPAQALTMMNNPFVVEQARVCARRLLESQPPDISSIGTIRRLACG